MKLYLSKLLSNQTFVMCILMALFGIMYGMTLILNKKRDFILLGKEGIMITIINTAVILYTTFSYKENALIPLVSFILSTILSISIFYLLLKRGNKNLNLYSFVYVFQSSISEFEKKLKKKYLSNLTIYP